jgi:two-component system, NarL family, sensor kinase
MDIPRVGLRRMWIAWVAWSMCAAGAIASLGLAALNGAGRRETGIIEALGNAGLALSFATVGGLLVSHRERNPVGWLLLLLGSLSAMQGFAQEYTAYIWVERPGILGGGEAVAWLNALTGEVTAIGLVALILLVFPDGHVLSRRWRLAAASAVLGIAMSMMGAFRPGPFRSAAYPEWVTNPLGVPGAESILSALEALGMFLMLGALILAVISMIRRFRVTASRERQQLKWLAFGGFAVVAFMVFTQAIFSLPAQIEESLYYLTFALLPAALGIAILKHDLYDIDRILSGTIIWGVLSTFIVSTYVIAVSLLGTMIHARGDLIPSLIATGFIAILFAPLRDRVQGTVDRFVYGDRNDPYAVVTRLGRRLEATLAPDKVLPTIVDTIAEALKLPYVAIELRQGPGAGILVAHGRPQRPLLDLPLSYQSELVGRLLLSPRSAADAFSPADLRVLEDLARQVGIAAHALRMTRELQRSRERLVTAREEERRRLRRDLHDGIGPTLASITLKLDAARNLLVKDPAAVDPLLADLKSQAQMAIGDIRRTVYDLRPPALDELGLISALQAHAARLENENLQITMHVPNDLPQLSAAIEVATYRIVVEGMTNIVRHAGATKCDIRLSVNSGLMIKIEDNGTGNPAQVHPGVGLTAMRERAEELGGSLALSAGSAGGLLIIVQLPLVSTRDLQRSGRLG